jgi:hypothetical protein
MNTVGREAIYCARFRGQATDSTRGFWRFLKRACINTKQKIPESVALRPSALARPHRDAIRELFQVISTVASDTKVPARGTRRIGVCCLARPVFYGNQRRRGPGRCSCGRTGDRSARYSDWGHPNSNWFVIGPSVGQPSLLEHHIPSEHNWRASLRVPHDARDASKVLRPGPQKP